MTFNIGSQSGGTFNNVAGSQYITGGQQTTAFTLVAEHAVQDLSALLRQLRLDPRTAGQAEAEVAEMTDAVRATPPDQNRVARAAERFTGLLKSAGALAGAGVAFIRPLQDLAAWLGPLGARLAAMLS